MKSSVFANYLNQVINICFRFFMIPIYIEAFGLGGYGFIGFYISLSSLFVLLDFGMGYASLKLLADKKFGPMEQRAAILSVVEKVYILIAVMIGTGLFFFSDLIANSWLEADQDSIDPSLTVKLISLLILVTWPQSLYQSFLMGQEKFLPLNAILILGHIISNTLMFVALSNYDFGVDFYFAATSCVMLLQTVLLRRSAFLNLPQGSAKKVSLIELKSFFSYSAGVSVFSVGSLFFFQAPSFILSSKAATSDLGLYNLGLTFPMALITLMYPIGSVFLPKFAQISNGESANHYFRSAALLCSAFILVGVAIFYLNIRFIYGIWFGDNPIPTDLILISRILVLGIFFYGLTMVLNNFLLINGKTIELGIVYFISALFFCCKTIIFNDTLSAPIVANDWRITCILLFLGVLFILAHQFWTAFLHWLKSVFIVIGLGSLALFCIWTTSELEISLFFSFVISSAVFSFFFSPIILKTVRTL